MPQGVVLVLACILVQATAQKITGSVFGLTADMQVQVDLVFGNGSTVSLAVLGSSPVFVSGAVGTGTQWHVAVASTPDGYSCDITGPTAASPSSEAPSLPVVIQCATVPPTPSPTKKDVLPEAEKGAVMSLLDDIGSGIGTTAEVVLACVVGLIVAVVACCICICCCRPDSVARDRYKKPPREVMEGITGEDMTVQSYLSQRAEQRAKEKEYMDSLAMEEEM
mmetsp:Transcript_18541/g.20685  ORF Transcript_18541/g.20685 Transcript_18541/m.20685 type:complete len:222 (+) Transcript_18541:73-738(+)|eukprot:CAMPEP_0205825138 /NCGR_PEP_ID=MMETSP0206-20130828/24078_1 /ASSEMBLY_ACC=CAM_ASM_000279 /TAXON_ID=36767 /ORGANISM="Euplotes focardii, Strain TN1" /LENGTH=221 /DNA_ID=CAMNT_0053123925 /DNA_START=72 /DNA_END=737 /DNA_ORIENTATION=+